MKRAAIAGALVAGLALGVWWFRWRGTVSSGGALLPAAPLFQSEDAPMDVLVYFATEDGALEPEKRVIHRSAERLNQMKQAVLEALTPPVLPGHASVMPAGVALRELYLDGKSVAYLDCSSELSAAHPGGSSAEWLTVQALVGCLMKNFEEIKSVQILVNGQAVDSLKGHVDVSAPLAVDPGLLRPLPEPLAPGAGGPEVVPPPSR